MDMGSISIIIPIHNGSKWLKQCFDSILKQTALGVLKLEMCICDDCSTDNTSELLSGWANIFQENGIGFKCHKNLEKLGVGASKNRAVQLSTGEYLCFQDIDDQMLPDRVLLQYQRAVLEPPNTLVGCKFERSPPMSTSRYTNWANNLDAKLLDSQVYTSHGPTIIMPTWFCHRTVFDSVGGFQEIKTGYPEDLVFFYRHLDLGGKIVRVDQMLLIYTYHQEQVTFSIPEEIICRIRLNRLERLILSKWPEFTIWNAGKQGRKFFKSLSDHNKKKVKAFCDVDAKKVGHKYCPFDEQTRQLQGSFDVVHFTKATPPFIVCVKMDLTDGDFERNLQQLNLVENQDYVMFS